MDAIRRKRGSRPTTMKELYRDTAGDTALAIFDLDGTIMSTNVIEQYLWARLPELSRTQQLAEIGQVIRRLPSYLRAEQRDRGTFLRAVYRRYRGADLAGSGAFCRPLVGSAHLEQAVAGGRTQNSGASRGGTHHDSDHRCGAAADSADSATVRCRRRC